MMLLTGLVIPLVLGAHYYHDGFRQLGLYPNTTWEVRELIFGVALAAFALHGARWPAELFLGGAPTTVVFGRATTLEDAEI
jgi:hypothetical protein